MGYNYVSYASGVPYNAGTPYQLGRYLLSTAATATAVSVAEVREHLRITAIDSGETTYLTNLINVATEMVQNYTGQILLDCKYDLHLPYFINRIDINRGVVSSIDHVKYYDSSNSLQTITASNYSFDGGHNDIGDQSPTGGFILPADNYNYPDTYPRMDAVRIKFNAGYDNASLVPMAIKQAMLLIIGEFYTNRVNRVHTMPTLAEYLLNPYKLATI